MERTYRSTHQRQILGKEKKEKKEGKKEFTEVLISRDWDYVFEILFGCKRRIF